MRAPKRFRKPSASAIFDFTLGNVYFQNDDTTNAVKHFETALAKFPDFRRAQKNLAFALVRQGKYADAIKPLLRTITLGGADGKVYGLLGFAYMDAGKPVSAEGAYRQALVFEPENMDFKMGLLKCSLATANYDHALALLDELLEQYPERESLWTLQANIYIQKEQRPKAAISLEMLRRLGKATPQHLFLLGDLYLDQEARDLALAAYLEAVEKDGGQNPAKALRPAQMASHALATVLPTGETMPRPVTTTRRRVTLLTSGDSCCENCYAPPLPGEAARTRAQALLRCSLM